ncbi:MAG: hypothetical protein GF320_11700 [Armatimonadia bacterium]|nr:hypothetical protein [Armatimonadia bacterium]
MKEQDLLEALEELAGRLDIRIRRESFRGDGGLCTLRGERLIIMNKSRTPAEQIDLLAASLGQVDLDGLFVPPQVREEIDRRREPPQDAASAVEDEPSVERMAG